MMNGSRFHSLDLIAILLLVLLVLISCQAVQPPPAPLPLEPVAATPDITPTPGAALLPAKAVAAADDDAAKGCMPGTGQSVYTDPAGAFCFAFPSSLALSSDEAQRVSLVGPPLTEGPAALFVSLGIESAPATQPLGAAVTDALAEFAGFTAWEIRRTETVLGGEAAQRVEPVPGQVSSRVLFAVHNGLLYRLTFWPAEEGPAAPDLEALYSAVTESFRFMQAADPTPQDQASGVISGSVRHGDTPVAEAPVTLWLRDERTNKVAAVMETASAPDGTFSLVGVPAGEYEVVATWPAGMYDAAPPAAPLPVTVGGGVSAATADLALAEPLIFTAPAAGGSVSPNPTLAWEPVTGATLYRVVVIAETGDSSPFAGDVTGATLALEPPLAPGDYQAIVNALGPNGLLLAEGIVSFTVEP